MREEAAETGEVVVVVEGEEEGEGEVGEGGVILVRPGVSCHVLHRSRALAFCLGLSQVSGGVVEGGVCAV